LYGDPTTGRMDPLLSTADGKSIVDQEDGERPAHQERWQLGLSEVPQCALRLDIMSSLGSTQDLLDGVLNRIRRLRGAIKAIHGSKEFSQLIEVSLAAANYLNSKPMGPGRYQTPKYGLRLEGISSYSDLRGNDRTSSLLSKVVNVFGKYMGDPKVVTFHRGLLVKLTDALTIKPEQLDADMEALEAALDKIKNSLEAVEPYRGDGGMAIDNYHKEIKLFLSMCSMDEAKEGYKAMLDEFEAAGKFYCFDPFIFSYDDTPMQSFFRATAKVFKLWDEAVQSLERAEHMAALKAKRAADRDKKLALQAKRDADSKGDTFQNMDKKMQNTPCRRRVDPDLSFNDEMAASMAAQRKRLGLADQRAV